MMKKMEDPKQQRNAGIFFSRKPIFMLYVVGKEKISAGVIC
jgi:hypothetical protein